MKFFSHFLSIFLMLIIIYPSALGDSFFSIRAAKYYSTKNNEGISFSRLVNITKSKQGNLSIPFIEVKVKTKKRTLSNNITAKAYFYNSSNEYTGYSVVPANAKRPQGDNYAMPVFFEANREESLYFVFPEELRTAKSWNAIIVFGDSEGISAIAYPKGTPQQFLFPEKNILDKQPAKERQEAYKPFLESTLTIRDGIQSHLTLFLFPKKNSKETTGVFAACLLANDLEEIRRRIMFTNNNDELYDIIEYCKKNNLTLLCWGAQTIWNKEKSWDEIDKEKYRDYDREFDRVAKAWTIGVNQLFEQKLLPKKEEFYLWGTSKAAQYAMRLAMRCPQYFHAVHIHIPSTFEKPSPEGNNVLWCITTGEREYGYERSLRFFQQCKSLGYPIIYKAIPGLGHTDHQGSKKFGFSFFDYAKTLLSVKQKRIKDIGSNQKNHLWNDEFYYPPFWGDAINQNIFPAEKILSISSSYRVPLPSEKLAKEWSQLK